MAKERAPERAVVTGNDILSRTHRIPQLLYDRICQEANLSGSAVNSEVNSLVRDGLRFREAKVTIHLEE